MQHSAAGITSPSSAVREYVADTEPAEWNATVDEALTQLNVSLRSDTCDSVLNLSAC